MRRPVVACLVAMVLMMLSSTSVRLGVGMSASEASATVQRGDNSLSTPTPPPSSAFITHGPAPTASRRVKLLLPRYVDEAFGTFAALTRPTLALSKLSVTTTRGVTLRGPNGTVVSLPTDAASDQPVVLVLRSWDDGHTAQLGCLWPEQGLSLSLQTAVPTTNGTDWRPVTAYVVMLVRHKTTTPLTICDVQTVLSVSSRWPQAACAAPTAPIAFLKYNPVATTAPLRTAEEVCITVEVGDEQTRAFFPDDTWNALLMTKADLSSEPKAALESSRGGSVLSRRRAPLQCDQGLYMGFTNIIQALITCVIHALLAGRTEVVFPGRFQHKSFDELFDGAALRAGVLRRYGVTLHLLPRATKVVTPNHFHQPIATKLHKLSAYRSDGLARPGVVLFTGDTWTSRVNTLIERQQLAWFNEGIYAPSQAIATYANRLTAEMQQLANSTGINGTWVALHLRLESDAYKMVKDSSSSGASAALATLVGNMKRRQLSQTPAYYASGELPADVQAGLPKHWRSKADYYPDGPWKEPYEGAWFEGKKYMITNATGSLVDMFLLLRAPLAIVSEISSFGEFVAAMRCPRRTIVYNKVGDFFDVPCDGLFMFNRGFREIQRRRQCGVNSNDVKCADVAAQIQTFAANAQLLDRSISKEAAANKKRRSSRRV